ncbi:MAG TPA: type II secretion system protein M [Burkholderiales bacterium]
MNESYQRALLYWRGLAPRERSLVAGGGALAVALLCYGLLWAPLQRDLARLRVNVPTRYEELQWMRSQTARLKVLRSAAPAALQTNGILSFVEQSAQAYNIQQFIKRVDPQGTSSVQLAIDGAPFNSVVEWLANLQKQGGVRIETASLEPQPTSGIVNARLLLRAPGS